ncbi:MAG: orotidine-5'-phosphate decarboxylase [Acidimicrobiia bacterium]
MNLDEKVTEKMVLNLDVGGLDDAIKLIKQVGDYFSYVKVGSELFAQAGPDSIAAIRDLGKKVFLDLKVHDIPNTVGRALEVHATRGISMTTVHASGGLEMLKAARKGLDDGAARAGFEPPILLAITVLTSLPPDQQAFDERLSLIEQAKCDLVCSALEVSYVAEKVPTAKMLVPGIRLSGQDRGDQTRVATPFEAIRDGATWIALGRAVYAADDPIASAQQCYDEVEKALNS